MASTRLRYRLRERIWTQRNITILVAIVVAVPTAYAFISTFGGTAGNFLLLMTLAVGVPTAYDEYWPQYDRTWKAVAWILVACGVASVEFTVLYLVGIDLLGFSPVLASTGAFLVTYLGTRLWLARRQRR